MDGPPQKTRAPWTTRKRDAAPRGVCRHPGGGWGIRYTCGAGCLHKEKVGPLKSEAMRLYHVRRNRARSEPGWCPAIESRTERARVQTAQARERSRVTFATYATTDYLPWARATQRSAATTESQVKRLVQEFGHEKLDAVTTAEVERFLNRLAETIAPATVNRYRDRLSGMFKRAKRLGLVALNPISGIPKLKEAGGRVIYLSQSDEKAIHDALPPSSARCSS